MICVLDFEVEICYWDLQTTWLKQKHKSTLTTVYFNKQFLVALLDIFNMLSQSEQLSVFITLMVVYHGISSII